MERMRKSEREKATMMIQRWWIRIRRNNIWTCDEDITLQTTVKAKSGLHDTIT